MKVKRWILARRGGYNCAVDEGSKDEEVSMKLGQLGAGILERDIDRHHSRVTIFPISLSFSYSIPHLLGLLLLIQSGK